MAACDVVVMPSRWEGFGLVAIEAMRLAKPVVASGVGGLREIIVEGVTGRLVPAEDPVALREALLADSAQRRAQMGSDGRRRFLERYCIDRTHAQLLRLYASAFRDHTSNRGARAPRDVFINGRFLAQRVGGVQRFAWEVIKALDQELSDAPSASPRNWTLVVPRTAPPGIALKRIAVKVIGRGRPGHFWDQFVLPRVARQGVVVNLTNGAPLLHPRCLVVIHDAAVFRTPENFAPVYVLLHRALGRLLSLKSSVGTVSEFSRSELAQILRIDRSRIFVVPNSCEHLGRVPPDDTVLGRLGLERNRYFLFVGKPSPNKNLTAAIAAFARLGVPGYRFVIVGMADPAIFRAGFDAIAPDILVAGHLSDPELVGLLQGATALLFPSLYEGFGIPPLEGMVTGCPVVASRIPAVLEVCGDAALYFDPKDVELITRKMRAIAMNPALRAMLIEKGKERASRFSWQFSARCLLDAIATVK
jgi:glycosyltransferase involved in cell wall biosynthesis